MIAGVVTDDKGNPVDGNGKKLSQSSYQPTGDVAKLFAQVQNDYTVAYSLQHRPFKEFDNVSLLERTRKDQETFSAFVGAEYIPAYKRWRWRGRKNTARNKIIGILAHMLSAMLFPYVRAINEHDEEDEDTAKVMQILIEDHLRKAGYELKFLYLVIAAMVNPAVFVGIDYVQATQKIKQRMKDGSVNILEAVDQFLSGMQINIIPVDELMLADFYTFELQRQPYIIRVRRIPWDQARAIYGSHPDFKFVEAGKTRVVLTGQENQTLFDVEWTEADRDYVQEITAFYRSEDLQATFVGGVFIGNSEDVYNTNPFEHRRMTYVKGQWASAPVYPFAKSGFEPLDATGRFAYYKSAAFKEYWDDASLNQAYQLLQDGMTLDVMKPNFISGVSKVDGTVIAPGASIPLPKDAVVTPYVLGPNLAAAMDVLKQNQNDMSESTQDSTQGGVAQQGVTARATIIAEQNAKLVLGVFGLMLSNLVEQIGALTMDCIIQYATLAELDDTVPEALKTRYRTFLTKGEEKGKKLSNRIVFTDEFMGISMTKEEKTERAWALYDQTGETPEEREKSAQRLYLVNPYQFARMNYTMYLDADQIVSRSMGTDQQRNMLAFQMMTDPRVAPYTDQEAVIQDFVIDQFSDGDPDRYMKKQGALGNIQDMMGAAAPTQQNGAPQPTAAAPMQSSALPAMQPM